MLNPNELYSRHAMAFVLGSLLLSTTADQYASEKRALEEALSSTDAELLAETKHAILAKIRESKVTLTLERLEEAEGNIMRQVREALA